MTRLRPLTESECYARLYGDRESTVAVLRESEPDRPSGGLLGDEIMRRLREQDADAAAAVGDVEEAA